MIAELQPARGLYRVAHIMRNTLLVGLLALAVPACLVGTGDITGSSGNPSSGGTDPGNGGDPGGNTGGSNTGGTTSTPRIAGTVDKTTVTSELGKTETLTYTITASGGFSGDVAVSAAALDSTGAAVTGYTLTPSAPSVTLTADGTATVSLDVKIPTDAGVLDPTIKLSLSSSAAPVDVTSAFTVAKQITILFDAGTGAAAPHTGLPQPNSRLNILSGTKIVFHNGDTIAHRIHGDGGIAHEQNDLAPGGDYTVTVTQSADWYCHDHENSTSDVRLVNVE